MVVVLSFVWFVDWTDCFILEGGIGIFDIFLRSVFVPKNFGFSDCVFIAVHGFSVHWHLVFVKNTCLRGFGFDLWCGFRIFLFGFWFLFDQSGHYAPPLNSKSRETSVCCTCQLCIGSIKVLRTGMWTFICFDGFACGFRFLIEFLLLLLFFAVLRMILFLRFLTDPLTDSCFAN